MTEKRESSTITIVYLGTTRAAKDGKEHRRFQVVTLEQATTGTPAPDSSGERWYKSKGFPKGMTPGAMYQVTEYKAADGTTAIGMNTLKPFGLWPSASDRAAWQEEDRSRRVDDEATKRIKDDDALFDSLATARRIYHAAGPRRHIVLARIVQLLTR